MCFLISTQTVYSEPQAGPLAGPQAGLWNSQKQEVEGGVEGCGLLAQSSSLVSCGDPVKVVSALNAGEDSGEDIHTLCKLHFCFQ